MLVGGDSIHAYKVLFNGRGWCDADIHSSKQKDNIDKNWLYRGEK